MAGTGPLLLAFSAELAEAGVNISMVAEAAPFRNLKARASWDATAWRFRTCFPELLPTVGTRRRGIPMRNGLVLREIKGEAQVQGAGLLSPYDAQWRPIPALDEHLSADIVCIGYGLSPSDELLRRMVYYLER